jgi:hypothetical protein
MTRTISPILKAVLEWVKGGNRVFATLRELHYLDDQGQTTRVVPNGGSAIFYAGPLRKGGLSEALESRPTVAKKNGDDTVLETYLQHANVTGYYEREARATWALFRSHVRHAIEGRRQRRRPQAGSVL